MDTFELPKAVEAARRITDRIENLENANAALIQDKETLHKQANMDPLTGILNRRGLDLEYARFREAHNRRSRRQEPDDRAYLLMIDLDSFKDVNDTRGHGEGDEVLKKVAEVLTKNVRQRDIVARIGGDEFLAILPRITAERANDAANAIREAIKDLTPITTSIGVGPVDFKSPFEDNKESADRALYAAKKNGKDIVVHFGQLGEVDV
jgi:diguanylate cyclase (GGDEF)-like protein